MGMRETTPRSGPRGSRQIRASSSARLWHSMMQAQVTRCGGVKKGKSLETRPPLAAARHWDNGDARQAGSAHVFESASVHLENKPGTRPKQKRPPWTDSEMTIWALNEPSSQNAHRSWRYFSLCPCTVPMSHGWPIRHLSHRHAQAHLIPTQAQSCTSAALCCPGTPLHRPSNVQASQAFSRRVSASATAWR